MLNFLWAGMIIVGVIFGVINGKVTEITNAALDSSKEAVSICITMMGVMSMWVGLMEVAKEAGIIEAMSRRMGGIVKFLFPQVPVNHPARAYIITNMIANFLGLGNAATPMGIQAAKRLKDPNRPHLATDELCRLIVLNTASIQLIPANVAAVRAGMGAASPFDILPAVWITSLCSAGLGLAAAWGMGVMMRHD